MTAGEIYFFLHLLGGLIFLVDIFLSAHAGGNEEIMAPLRDMRNLRLTSKDLQTLTAIVLFIVVWPIPFVAARLGIAD